MLYRGPSGLYTSNTLDRIHIEWSDCSRARSMFTSWCCRSVGLWWKLNRWIRTPLFLLNRLRRVLSSVKKCSPCFNRKSVIMIFTCRYNARSAEHHDTKYSTTAPTFCNLVPYVVYLLGPNIFFKKIIRYFKTVITIQKHSKQFKNQGQKLGVLFKFFSKKQLYVGCTI